MRRLQSALLLLFLALASGCAGAPKLLFRLRGTPEDALVHINDRYVGQLGRVTKSGIRLSPGEYRVTVDAVGYFPHDQLVVIDEQTPPAPLVVELEEIPD